LKRSRTDLASAISRRNRLLEVFEATEKEIAQLKRLIGGTHAYVDESDKSDDVGQTGEGLKEAVCTALRAANHDVTISEILAILRELQFPIESHQSPLGLCLYNCDKTCGPYQNLNLPAKSKSLTFSRSNSMEKPLNVTISMNA
jgi:hypothetical protein